jgi:hypothetical protein
VSRIITLAIHRPDFPVSLVSWFFWQSKIGNLNSKIPVYLVPRKSGWKNSGVEVRLGHAVDKIDEEGVMIAGERIASKTVIWTAGVAPSPAGKWLGVETDRAGRVRVQRDLRVPGLSGDF